MEEAFKDRLIDLMNERQLTAFSLAKSLNCTSTTICDYRKGKYLPSSKMLIRLANFFNCSTDYIFGITVEYGCAKQTDCPDFSTWIPSLLKEFGVTKKDLCIKADISEKIFFSWLRNETMPSSLSVYKMAKFLNCSMDYVYGR